MAARGGSLDCVRMLLAYGADRLQLDSSGYVNVFYSLRIYYSCQCRSPLKIWKRLEGSLMNYQYIV